ncbi:hypothetical protein [Actinocorallia populi]|uniref:hypothetical protein n=1 Tax=Actinocorallia populi TaxID=2079200 RepID=UPI000D096328|nr:hypothetical protein [Actinocorallia populi]
MAATSKAEAVRSAGGLMFDRVTAGWDVVVLTADGGDPRSLRILGARSLDLDIALACRFNGIRPQVIAVDAGLCDADPRVRGRLLKALEEGGCEVRICGGHRTAPAVSGTLRHRLSAAARAFKAQALAAVATSETGGIEEVFQKGDLFHHSKSA